MLDKKIYYPWVSLLSCLAMFLYLSIVNDRALFDAWELPDFLLNFRVKIIILILLLFVLFSDIVLFRNRKKEIDNKLEKFNNQITELYTSRNSLQNRLQKYSGHADKLKLFISDRLLEYIEYDEKFLHFQNIASEVRHNGVISYDKVNTVLKKSYDLCNVEDKKEVAEAIHSMTYLWDLLDLSTTDNIGLYIADKLYKAEEEYYRQQFSAAGDESPNAPSFSTREAIVSSISPFVKDMGNIMPVMVDKDKPYVFSNSRFRVFLNNADSLLGNENYILLMMENLINNALFYQNQRKYSHKYSRVSIGLKRSSKYAKISVYNNGPWINDETREKLFQLGFSTKRSKGVNGKGLGLYFVNEIVKGYEGKIEVRNIENRVERYTVKIKLNNDEVVEQIIAVTIDDGKPICTMNGEACSHNEATMKVSEDIIDVHIVVDSQKKNYVLNYAKNNEHAVFYDPQNQLSPEWCVEFKQLKTTTRVMFKIIDKMGVQFDIYLPTAESRLETDYYDLDDEETNKLDDVGVEFDDFSDFTK